MAASSSPTLTCAQCGYVNEAERVYCHNCGAKLDRSLLPKELQRKSDSPAASRRRVKRMTNPGSSSPAAREFKTLVKTIWYAALVAVLILIVLQPADVPGRAGPAARRVDSDMAAALQTPRPLQFSFDENDINNYLASVKSKTKGWIPGVDFKRAFVQLRPGVIRIGMEQSAWGYSFYTTIDERVGVSDDGTFWAQQAGGRFGRLAIHPVLMEYADGVFNHLWNALGRERKQMDSLRSITVEKGRVVLVTTGVTAP